MKRRTRSFWEKLVAEVRAGSSAGAVAARHRVRVSTLRWWCWELGRSEAPEASLRLVPIVAPTPARAPHHIEIAWDRSALRVEEGTDVDYVVALARALRDAC